MAQHRFSNRCPAVKRLMKEAQELRDPTEQYYACPLEDNLFEWHFTFRGPSGSEYDGGVYHGRITFPPEYPMKPPSIMLLTPTGRFKVAMNICLSISGHHPETWQPSWSIRTVLLAIMGFMPTHGGGAIGSLDYTAEERKVLAKRSKDWQCPVCKVKNKDILPAETSKEKSEEMQREAAKVVAQVQLKKQKDKEESSKGQTVETKSSTEPELTENGNTPSDVNDGGSNQTVATSTTTQSVTSPTTNTTTQTPASSVQPSEASSLPQTSQSSFVSPPLVTRSPGANSAQSLVNAAQGENSPQSGVSPAVRPRQQGSNGVLSIVLMILLSLAILLLIMRRIYINYEYKFHSEL